MTTRKPTGSARAAARKASTRKTSTSKATRGTTTRTTSGTRRRRSTTTRRTTTRRTRPKVATTVGAALGTLVVTLLLDASWPVRIGLVLLALALVGGYLHLQGRRHDTAEAPGPDEAGQVEPTPPTPSPTPSRTQPNPPTTEDTP